MLSLQKLIFTGVGKVLDAVNISPSSSSQPTSHDVNNTKPAHGTSKVSDCKGPWPGYPECQPKMNVSQLPALRASILFIVVSNVGFVSTDTFFCSFFRSPIIAVHYAIPFYACDTLYAH